jgi:hypothetical protein
MALGLVIGFIERLQIVTTNNYSTIANSHTLLFTAICMKSLPSAQYSPVSSASVLTYSTNFLLL